MFDFKQLNRILLLSLILFSLIYVIACGTDEKKKKSTTKKVEMPLKTKKPSMAKKVVKKEKMAKAVILDPAKVKPNEAVAPADLRVSFKANKDVWKGKTVTVKGRVNSLQDASKKKEPKYYISLRNPENTSAAWDVYCEFNLAGGKKIPKAKVNAMISIKGKIDSDFFGKPKMIDCELVK